MSILKLSSNKLQSFLLRGLSTSSTTATDFRDVNSDDIVEIENPFKKEKPQCILCKHNIKPDYKNVKLLSQFVSPFTGRSYGRHITGLCKKKQDDVLREVRKSQNAGFMPYYTKDPEFLDAPKLFNPERPFRPHDYA